MVLVGAEKRAREAAEGRGEDMGEKRPQERGWGVGEQTDWISNNRGWNTLIYTPFVANSWTIVRGPRPTTLYIRVSYYLCSHINQSSGTSDLHMLKKEHKIPCPSEKVIHGQRDQWSYTKITSFVLPVCYGTAHNSICIHCTESPYYWTPWENRMKNKLVNLGFPPLTKPSSYMHPHTVQSNAVAFPRSSEETHELNSDHNLDCPLNEDKGYIVASYVCSQGSRFNLPLCLGVVRRLFYPNRILGTEN